MSQPLVANLKNWLLAARPKTIWASISPVLIGTAMAYGDGVYHFPSAFAALLGAVLIQVGTNLANDHYDGLSGVDAPDRRGPVRVTQSGLIPPSSVKWMFISCFVLAAVVGTYLIVRAGLPVLIIGVLSVMAGLLYSCGPKPFSHSGLGDILAFVFFGPVAVAGAYYVQSFECNWAVIAAGFAPGLYSAAILAVNNLRDIETDRRAGKITLAVRFGKSFARCEYLTCIFLAALIPALIQLITGEYPWLLFSSLSFLILLPSIKTVYISEDGNALNNALAQTGLALFIYSMAFSIAWLI